MEEINLTLEQIEELRDIASERDIISDEELESMKDLKKTITENPINLAALYIKSYDTFAINIFEFKNDSNDYSGEIKKLLEQHSIDRLRDLIELYDGGKGYGDALTESNIRSLVGKNRNKYLELIKLFYQVFGEE